MLNPAPLIWALGLASLCPAVAGTPASNDQDKSAYHLFNPTPDALLRDLDTDRPDKTNSPHTLDPGHIQIETGLFSYTRTQEAGVRTQNRTWGDTTLRLGLTDWAEMQFEIPIYQTNSDTVISTHKTDRGTGIGDLTAIIKANLWGNEAGDTAAGLEAFVKSPTANRSVGNGETEGGALFLLETKLPRDFDCGINIGVAINANDAGGCEANIIDSISVSHEISGPLSGYVEFYTSVPARHNSDWVGTVDLGLLLMIGKNSQVDAGINIGVTPRADDLQPFVGVSHRF